jgi:hypothetical protein
VHVASPFSIASTMLSVLLPAELMSVDIGDL